jgi:uncharacterized protein (DUF2147 family)
MTMSKKAVVSMLLTVAASLAMAQATPVGLWKSIDDKTKKERALIRIADNGGVISGKIEKRLDPDAKADDVCDKCTDDRKDKKVEGLEIIRGVKKNVDDGNRWDSGHILDPENGSLYRVRLTPLDGGKKLEVRGFIGPFYRNQQWIRVE